MALIAFAGFEDNNLLEVKTAGTVAVVTTAPRTGTYHLRANCSSTPINNAWIMQINKSEFYFQYALRKSDAVVCNGDRQVFQWRDSTGNIMGCFVHTTAEVYKVYIGNAATLIGTAVTPIATTYLVVEGYIKIDESAGRVVLKINGMTEVDFTGNTKPGDATEVANIRHGSFYTIYGSIYMYFDDIIVQDVTGSSFNSWPMGIKCHKVAAPAANGNYHAWTPSAGDNFECIDEVPPSMDDFLTGAVGNKDSYAFGDAPAGITGIAGVVTRYYGQGDGNIKRLCRHGGTDYLSAAFPLPGTFGKVDSLMDLGPGGAAWDETVFNACEFGMEQQ